MEENLILAILKSFEDLDIDSQPEASSSTRHESPPTDLRDIPKLRGLETFKLWQEGLKTHLATCDLSDHIALPGASEKNHDETWRSDDALVRHAIKATVPAEISESLRGDAKDMYTAVCGRFESRPLNAFHCLVNIRWDGHENRIEFTRRWSNASHDWILQTGGEVTDQYLSLLYLTAIQSANGYEVWTSADNDPSGKSIFQRPLSELIRSFCLGGLLVPEQRGG